MSNFEKFLKNLEDDMKQEAFLRLKMVKPNNPELIEEYKNNVIYVQDISAIPRYENRLRKANKVEMELVNYMQEEGNLPYLILVDERPATTIYYFLYVGYNKKDWNLEHLELQLHEKGYRCPYVWEIDAGLRLDYEEPINAMFNKYTKIQINLD